jgi:hypothetical protein
MIFPERRSIIWGSTARTACIAPTRLVFSTSAQSRGLLSEKGPMGPCTPAAQTSTCTPP